MLHIDDYPVECHRMEPAWELQKMRTKASSHNCRGAVARHFPFIEVPITLCLFLHGLESRYGA
jgi:hypothetical protein